jgi:ABC-type Mn2+/Zn2+ transport system permease subunit
LLPFREQRWATAWIARFAAAIACLLIALCTSFVQQTPAQRRRACNAIVHGVGFSCTLSIVASTCI